MASYEQRGSSVRAIVRVPGGGRETATFDTMAQARAWGAQMERKKALNELNPGDKVLVGDALQEYLDEVASKKDSARNNALRITAFQRDPIAKIPVTKITTYDINGWINRRTAMTSARSKTGGRVKSNTVIRELTLLSAAFTYMIKTRKWIDENPCHGANPPAAGPSRKRPLLTAAEIKAICIATGYTTDSPLTLISNRVGACFLLALETGMRSGEILRLRPKDYNKADRTIFVAAEEKGGRKGSRSGHVKSSRTVPLTMRAIQLLDQLMAHRDENQPYIVGLTDQQRDANWRKCRNMSGVEDLAFHDTKHEAATRLCKFLDVIELSHAIGTKDLKLLRDTYYANDAKRAARQLPDQIAVNAVVA